MQVFRFNSLRLHIAALLVCLSPSIAQADDVSATLAGRVTTSAGAPLAGVRVVAQSPELTLERVIMSGLDGTFVLPLLPAGEYVVTFSRDEFVTVRHATRLSALETVAVTIAMTTAEQPAELIRVSIDTDRFPERPASIDLLRQPRLDWLPIEGSLFSVAARAPGAIGTRSAGAHIGIDGVPVRFFRTGSERPLVNPGRAALADATIALSALPAEITHLQSGAISVVPRRGGDRIGGIVNATFGTADRSADSLHEARDTRGAGGGFDAGVGVPLNGRRTWIYGAAGRTIDHLQPMAHLSGLEFAERADDRFWDLHANHAFSQDHRIRGTAIRADRSLAGARPLGAVSIEEPTAADERQHAHTLMAASYNGLIGTSSYLSAGIAGERWRAETRDRPTGLPAVWDLETGGVAGAAGSCAECELDDRTNVAWNASVRRSSSIAGSLHLFTVGVTQGFGEIDPPEAAPAGSLDILASRFTVAGDQVFPVLEPNGSSWIVQRNGSPDALSHLSHGVFISDEWRPSGSVTLQAGVRWDRQRLSLDDGSQPALVRSGFSPRVHASWQPDPRGWTFSGGLARYEADLLHLAGERLAPWGDWYPYQGSPVNTAIDPVRLGAAAVGGRAASLVPTLDPRFTGSGATWSALLAKSASELAPTVEWTLGASGHLLSGMQVRADLIWQRSGPLDLTSNPLLTGPQDFTALSFARPSAVDVGLLSRRYTALVLQGTYDLGVQASVGGRYTLSRLSGDLDNRAAASPVANWASPSGDLAGDRRHRFSVWGQVAPVDSEERGTLGIIAMHSVESGEPFGAVAWVDVGPWMAPSPDAPVLMPYYFTARDEFRSGSVARTDFAVRYARRLPGTVRTDLIVQFHVLNAWNSREVLNEGSFTAARTAFTNPSQFAPFNPLTDQPQQGVHWDLEPRLTTALGTAEQTMPRAYRIVAGIRF